MAANVQMPELPPNLQAKLKALQEKLGAEDLASALDKSLNIANYVAETVKDPGSKLLVERSGKFTELTDIR